MEKQPRWAEMCAAILKQCEVVRGGRESLAQFLGVHPQQVALWISGRSGPPRAVFEKAMEIILAEHDRRAAVEQARPSPRRRRTDQESNDWSR
jgi:DNA-binding transcriptional regulator YdaS (Cro superfamily)